MSDRAVPQVRKALGVRMRELRKQAGLSQHRLGLRTGISGKFIGEVERGQKSISVDNLHALSEGVGASLGEILANLRPKADAEIERLLALARTVRPKDASRVLKVLRALIVR